jgi:hypothetical protein
VLFCPDTSIVTGQELNGLNRDIQLSRLSLAFLGLNRSNEAPRIRTTRNHNQICDSYILGDAESDPVTYFNRCGRKTLLGARDAYEFSFEIGRFNSRQQRLAGGHRA